MSGCRRRAHVDELADDAGGRGDGDDRDAAEFDRVEVTVIECDAKISRVRVLTESSVSELRSGAFKGGGGTDLRPPFTYLESSPPACLIYLTDGDGPAPQRAPSFPVLWVLTEQGTPPTSWGQSANIKTT